MGILAIGVALCASAVGFGGGAADVVWGIKNQGGFAFPPSHLFNFTPDGNSFTDLGAVSMNGSTSIVLDGLAIDAGGGLYAFLLDGSDSQLVQIAPNGEGSGPSASTVGSAIEGRVLRGAVIDDQGRLLALDLDASQLVEVSLKTGALIGEPVDLISDCMPIFTTGTDIAQSANGAYWVALPSGSGGAGMFQLYLPSGRLVERHSDNASDDGTGAFNAGLAFSDAASPSVAFTYEVNFQDDLFAYDISDGWSRTELFANIIPQFNAGRGDLAAVSTVTGSVPGFADLNGDGVIDTLDLLEMLGVWGSCIACDADLNCDGIVDTLDLLLLLGMWG